VSEPLARFIFQQLILALDYCHRKGKVSRDVKLANTLLVRGRRSQGARAGGRVRGGLGGGQGAGRGQAGVGPGPGKGRAHPCSPGIGMLQ
jgi:serine/threonine protein kinase